MRTSLKIDNFHFRLGDYIRYSTISIKIKFWYQASENYLDNYQENLKKGSSQNSGNISHKYVEFNLPQKETTKRFQLHFVEQQ